MVASRPSLTPLYLRATSSDCVVDMKEASTPPAQFCPSSSKNSVGSASAESPRNTAPPCGILAMVGSVQIPDTMSWIVVGYRFAVAETSPDSIYRRSFLFHPGPTEQTRRQSLHREKQGRCSKIETTRQPYRLPANDFLTGIKPQHNQFRVAQLSALGRIRLQELGEAPRLGHIRAPRRLGPAYTSAEAPRGPRASGPVASGPV